MVLPSIDDGYLCSSDNELVLSIPKAQLRLQRPFRSFLMFDLLARWPWDDLAFLIADL